jgi:signal transduction histidine kinase
MTDLESRLRQQETVVELGQQALSGAPLDALMNDAVRRVTAALDLDISAIFDLESEGRGFVLSAAWGFPSELVGTARVGAGFESAVGFALLASGPLVVEDLGAETRFNASPLVREHGVTCGVWVTIDGRPKPRGALAALSRGRRRFTPDEIHFLRAVANVLASAVERERAGRENEDLFIRERQARAQGESARERAAFLSNISRVLASSLDYERTLQNIARLAVPYAADGCIVDMVQPDGTLRRVAVAGLDRAAEELAYEMLRRYPPAPGGPHPMMVVVRTGRSIVLPEISDELLVAAAHDAEHLRLARGLGLTSALIVPIQARGRMLGALSFVSGRSGRRYSAIDLDFAEDLAHRAALAADNARLYQDAERARADAEAANRAKDDFLATLSHELRTTLTSILGWTRLLRTDRLSPDSRERALESIERNAAWQVRLIEDLLDVSRIAAGKVDLRLAPVEVRGVLEAAADIVGPDAAAKGVRLDTALAADLGTIRADAARIGQVVGNLLVNAVKFTPTGGRVDLRASREPGFVRIDVVDTGIGIAPELLPRVFDRFSQGGSELAGRPAGLGLGLAIVRDLVELHGGTVGVASEGHGRGSTFTVVLPAMS